MISIKGSELAKVLIHYGLIDYPEDNQKIVCPFHDDVNPSMIIDYDEGRCFCFGCNWSGDALKFVMEVEKSKGVNDLEACKKFFKIINDKALKEVIVKKRPKKERIKEEKQLFDEAYDYYYGLKTINWQKDRGMIDEVEEVGKYMEKRGFKRKSLTKIKAKVTFNKSYPIIFPLMDNGDFKGWVCRTTLKSIEKKRKYLYNKGFKRVNCLVGRYDSTQPVILVEGFMDLLKIKQFGYRNVVAVLGWKLSTVHIEKLKKAGCEHIISALDNDECGKKGTRYAKKFFKVTRWCYLKGVKDPGDMNEEQWKKMFEKTMKRYKEEH